MRKQCCILNCGTWTKEKTKKTLFSVPKDPELNEKWMKIIRPLIRKCRTFHKNFAVCEDHFLESDIERYYETKLPGNVIHRIPRDVPRLKPQAIPQKFRLSMSKSTDNSRENENNSRDCIGERNLQTTCQKSTEPQSNIQDSVNNVEPLSGYTFEAFVQDLKGATFSTGWISMTLQSSVILACSKLSALDFSKCIYIGQDMLAKIFVNNCEVDIEMNKNIICLQDVKSLICFIDKMMICRGLEPVKSTCLKLFEPTSTRHSQRCISCRVNMKRLRDQKSRRKILRIRMTTKRKRVMRNLKGRISQLEKKVRMMELNMESMKEKCAVTKEEAVADILRNLPREQQEAVSACIRAKCSGPKS